MLRQFVVLFFIPLELFPLPATDSTKDLLFTPLIVIVTLQHAHILTIVDQLGIGRIDMAFAKREIMNGIQQIGLSLGIAAHDQVYPRIEGKMLVVIVPKAPQIQLTQLHGR